MERGLPPRQLDAATLIAIREVAAAIRTGELPAVARIAVEHARKLLRADAAVVFEFRPATGRLEPVEETDSAVREPAVRPGEGAVGIAFEAQIPVVVPDYQAWPQAVATSASRGMVAALAVPLLIEGEAIGAIGVWTYRPRRFTKRDTELLALFAAQLAPAMAAARLLEQRREKERATRTLLEVAAAAAGLHDHDALGALVSQKAAELVSGEGGSMAWWDDEAGVLRPLASVEGDWPEDGAIQPGEGALGFAFALREPIVVEDYPAWEHATESGIARGQRSMVAVPLLVGDRAVGALGVFTRTPHRFDSEAVELLQLLASQVGPAVEATRLLSQGNDQIRGLSALHEVAVAAGGVLDAGELAALVAERARDLLGVDSVVLRWWDPERDVLRLVAALGPHSSHEVEDLELSVGVMGIAFKGQEPVILQDYAASSRANPVSVADGVKTAMAVPLTVGKRVVGVLAVNTYAPHVYGAEQVRLLSLLAAQVAPALQAARLAEESTRQTRIFRTLHELAVAAGGVLEPAVLAQLATDEARALLGVERVVLNWYDSETGDLRVLAESDAQGRLFDPAIAPGEGLVGAVFGEAAPLVVDDYPSWDHALDWAVKRGTQSAVGVPLLAKDRPVGALAALTRRRRTFTAGDVQLLSLIAAQVSPALEAARLHGSLAASERDFRAIYDTAPMSIARNDLQGNLLSMNPTGLELFGYTEEEIAGLPHANLIAPADRDNDSALFWELVQGKRDRYRLERRYLRKDGTEFWGDVTQILVRDPSGRPEFYYSLLEDVTERKLAEEALRSSEARKSAILEGALDSIVATDREGRIVEFNPAAEGTFGRRRAAVLGRSMAELLLAPAAGEQLRAGLAELGEVKAGHAAGTRFETTGLRADGEEFPVELSISVFEQGGETMYSASIRDLTDQLRAEAARRESEGRFRAVFDRAALGIARIDLKGRVIEANPALHRMLGYLPNQLIGLPLSQVIHSEDRDERRYDDLAAGRASEMQVELRYLHKHGVQVWCNTVASLVRGADGEPRFVLALIEDITVRKAQTEALEHRALHDALTDLPNRSLLRDRLDQAILAGRRDRSEGAFMIMDLDRFKEVNDAFGHQCGDALLQQVAVRLRAELRGSDTVARLGGDEFAVVLPDVDAAAGAVQAARKLLRAIEPAFTVEGERLEIGASLGIAIFPDHGDDADLLMRHADAAMYTAKRSNSGFAVYSRDQDSGGPSRLALVGELRQGIERGELVLHYQPKVGIRTRRIDSVEALVRWRHPTRGLLQPGDFVPLAENTGLIRPLGIWVVEAALSQCEAWRAQGLEVRIAVNLSMRNLLDPDLQSELAAQLAAHPLPAGSLQVEITESALMADPEQGRRVLGNLDRMGVRLAIDDFGTGYSSLSYLRQLPVEEIKIDQSFVKDMSRVENDAVIVRSTIDLGHNLGLRVVAEGVEDEKTWNLLAGCQCDLVQGFYVSGPESAEELTRHLRSPSFIFAGERPSD